MLERCHKCKGQRKYMGAGMIFHDCDTCLKIGYVETTKDEKQPEEAINVPRKTAGKRMKAHVNQNSEENR